MVPPCRGVSVNDARQSTTSHHDEPNAAEPTKRPTDYKRRLQRTATSIAIMAAWVTTVAACSGGGNETVSSCTEQTVSVKDISSVCDPSHKGPSTGPERRSWVEFARTADRTKCSIPARMDTARFRHWRQEKGHRPAPMRHAASTGRMARGEETAT